jgi:glycosyltransferase involved in cell wall biosynthesis
MARCAIVSFRLGLSDGVSVVAASWARALNTFGFDVVNVAGEGPVDRCLPALAMQPTHEPAIADLEAALADADLVVVENLCTIPLNLPAARAVAKTLRGRPAVLHHHDPPWQRPHFAHVTELPPNDPTWRHVTINDLTRREFAARDIETTVIYNGFDPDPSPGDREKTREILDVEADERLLVHPVRAIPRKNIPGALRLAEEVGATYWLVGPAAFGYDNELDALLKEARCRVIHRTVPGTMSDVYAAADAVVFPSTWEGFGNPPIEAALHRRPAAVSHYPVADELRAFGFEWFDPDDPTKLDHFLRAPDDRLLERNHRIAVERFSFDRMTAELRAVLDDAGWLP